MSESNTTTHVYYIWLPKEDITAYELALCMPMMLDDARLAAMFCLRPSSYPASLVNLLPDGAKRHFVKREEQYDGPTASIPVKVYRTFGEGDGGQ